MRIIEGGRFKAFEPTRRERRSLRAQSDEMRCPKCGRLELRDAGQGITCRICGYSLSPGESDKYRLYRLLKEEDKGTERR